MSIARIACISEAQLNVSRVGGYFIKVARLKRVSRKPVLANFDESPY